MREKTVAHYRTEKATGAEKIRLQEGKVCLGDVCTEVRVSLPARKQGSIWHGDGGVEWGAYTDSMPYTPTV